MVCVWSIETIQYRIGWEFYTKIHKLDAFGKPKHYGKWRSFPDIMYQEPGYKQLKGTTPVKCQEACVKDKKCQAFSFDTKKERCFLTDAGIHYDPSFTYFERRGMGPKKNALDEADKQSAIQQDEKSAKAARRARLVSSMQKMEKENNDAMTEMKAKSDNREIDQKKEEKKLAEKRLGREKTLEKRDKRLARMKAVYNEGYFKAKGVAAEKKTKEKDIKHLRAKETDEKDKRKRSMERHSKRKKTEKKKRRKERDIAKDNLVDAKEKITKVKNQEVELEIEKEDKVLDIAKNLALAKEGQTSSERMKEKDTKADAIRKEQRLTKEAQFKTEMRNMQVKQNKAQLKYLKKMSERKVYDENVVNVTRTED